MLIYNAVSGTDYYAAICIRLGIPRLLFTYAYQKNFETTCALLQSSGRTLDHVIMDSGAYTTWSKGKPMDVKKYIQYLHGLKHPGVKIVTPVNLDVIPGSPGERNTPEMVEKSAVDGMANYDLMRIEGLFPIPVYHQGERLEWLDKMLDRTAYLCISPANDKSKEQRALWCDMVFGHLERNNVKVRAHGLGVTTLGLMCDYPWYSCDSATPVITGAKSGTVWFPILGGREYDFSTSWRLQCGNNRREGKLSGKGKAVGMRDGFFDRSVDLQIAAMGHKDAITSKKTLDSINGYFEWVGLEYGEQFTYKDLDDYKKRVALNVIFFNEWENQFSFVKKQTTMTAGFFSGRG